MMYISDREFIAVLGWRVQRQAERSGRAFSECVELVKGVTNGELETFYGAGCM